jgi:hypothetical protein
MVIFGKGSTQQKKMVAVLPEHIHSRHTVGADFNLIALCKEHLSNIFAILVVGANKENTD